MSGVVGLAVLARVKCGQLEHKIIHMDEHQVLRTYARLLFFLIQLLLFSLWSRRRRRWLRHCAKSRKVVVSILVEVIGIFQLLNPCCHTRALRSTRPLTELSTRLISWREGDGSKGGWCVGLTSLPSSCNFCLEIVRTSASWSVNGLSRLIDSVFGVY